MNYLLLSVIALAPLYVWRFGVFGVPANFLLIWSAVVIAVFFFHIAISSGWKSFFDQIKALHKAVKWLVLAFLSASVLSLFTGGVNLPNLGQWLVLYLLPIAYASIIYYQSKNDDNFNRQLKVLLYLFVSLAGTLAIVQYFTLWTVPESWWGNSDEPKRAISFFAHPNAFSLYLTPILAWLFADLADKFRHGLGDLRQNWVWAIFWLLGAFGLFLSLSRGAWLALVVAVFVYAIVKASKKTLLTAAVGLVVLTAVIASVPNLRYRVMLPFQGEKSTVARFSLWDTGWKMVKDSPVLGKGVNGFNRNWDNFNTDPNLEHYNFPHNIFLNFWVDTGLLGVVSFTILNLTLMYMAWVRRKESWLAAGLLLFIVAIFVQGLIDIPYFKNDLAMIYWVIVAFSLSQINPKRNHENNI